MDQFPCLGNRELICLLLFTCNYVVSVWRGFFFLWMLGIVVVLCILTRPVKGWLKAQNHKGLVIRLLFLRATTKLIL